MDVQKAFRKGYPIKPFRMDTWNKTPSQKLLCCKCHVDCLICKNKHNLGNNYISFVQCSSEGCSYWSYYLVHVANNPNSTGYKHKYKVDIKQIKCS